MINILTPGEVAKDIATEEEMFKAVAKRFCPESQTEHCFKHMPACENCWKVNGTPEEIKRAYVYIVNSNS